MRKSQASSMIFVIGAILLSTLIISYVIPQLGKSGSISREVTRQSLPLSPRAEVVSYYTNGTHIFYYVKVYDHIYPKDIHFYINGKPAQVITPNKTIIEPGDTITVIGKLESNVYVYDLMGNLGRGIAVKYQTPPIENITVVPRCTWFLSDWKCRIPIYVSFSGNPLKEFQLNMTLDTQTLISQGKLNPDCSDLRFTAVYPYEGTDYTEGLILNTHFDNDVTDYSGLNYDGLLSSGTFVPFVFNSGLENGTVTFPDLNLTQFTITTWISIYNNTLPFSEDWWDTNWKYRIPINVYNGNSYAIRGYPIKINLDTSSLYAQKKVNSDLSDIRVVEKVPAYVFNVTNPNLSSLSNYQIKRDILDYSGKRMQFDGTDDYIEVPDSASLDITNQITICAWINTSSATDQMIVGKNDAYLFAIVNAGVLYFNYHDGSNWAGYSYSNTKVNDGENHFVCVTYDSSTGSVKFYIDGQLDNTVSVTASPIHASTYNLVIGGMPDWSGWYFNGNIDEVRIYNRVLSADEISKCFRGICTNSNLVLYHSYDDGTATDLSGNGNNGVIYGAVSVEPGIKGLLWQGNFSVYNPSTKSYLNFCFEQLNGECSQEYGRYIWIKVDNLPANSNTTLAIIPEESNNAVNGDQVFDFYDDFNDGVLDSSKWYVYLNGGISESNEILSLTGTSKIHSLSYFSPGYILETRVYHNDIRSLGFAEEVSDNIDYSGDLVTIQYNPSRTIFDVENEGDESGVTSITLQTGVWKTISIIWKNNYAELRENGVTITSTISGVADGTPTIPIYLYTYSPDNELLNLDWIRVRKTSSLQISVYDLGKDFIQVEIPFIFETSSGFSNTDSPSNDTWIWAELKYLPANANETVYVYYGNPSASSKSYTQEEIFDNKFAEIGKITIPQQSAAGEWFSFSFANTFDSTPVLIVEPDVTYSGSQPFSVWLRSITTTGFQARQKEPSDLDDTHASEDVFYIAIPKGSWETTGGVRVEAGRFNTTNWDVGDASVPAGAFTTVYYIHPFSSNPSVMTQIQEISDTLTGGWEAHTRIQNIGTSSFETAPEPQGSVRTQPTIDVRIGWIAIESHTTNKDIAKYVKSEAGISSTSYDEAWRTLSFSDTYTNPGFIGWIATNSGQDSSRLRGDNLGSTGISLMIQEDTSYDSETGHVYEAVSYFVFEYPGSPMKVYLRNYIPNISESYESEESIEMERYKIFSKKDSFGLEVLNNIIYGFVNTTDGYYEISYPLSLDTTYFISLSYDGTYLKLYVNGRIVNITSASGSLLSNSNPLTINFKGRIDELRLYNYPLSEDRILEEYNDELEKEIPYWFDPNTCNAVDTLVYVKLPILTTQRVYMYYCNPDVTSKSDGNSVFIFFDNLETFSGWTTYNSGTVVQDCSVSYDYSCSAHKINNNDPNGAYKDIGASIGRNVILEFWVNRNPSYTGGSVDRIGLIDNSGNGYGWLYSHGGDYVGIDKRTSYSATILSSSSATDYTGTWVFGRFTIKSDGTIISERYVNGALSGKTTYVDTSYYTFSRVYIFGGYDYWVDQIRIRKYVEPWPSYSFGSEETC